MARFSDIQNSLGFQLANLLKLKRRFIDLQMKELGLSRTQWQVLLWMKILGPCSQKSLLANLDIDAAHLARVLEEFEKNKYIVRSAAKEDRRSLFIKMTDYSKLKLIPNIEKALKEENTALLRGLNSEDKDHLKKSLKKLEENMLFALSHKEREISAK